MSQIGIKGLLSNLQTSVKKNDDGELEAVIKFTCPHIAPLDLHRLFQAQRAGHLEFSISSPQLELFSSKGAAAEELPLN